MGHSLGSDIQVTISLQDLELLRSEAEEGWKDAERECNSYLAVMKEYYQTGKVKEWEENRELWCEDL